MTAGANAAGEGLLFPSGFWLLASLLLASGFLAVIQLRADCQNISLVGNPSVLHHISVVLALAHDPFAKVCVGL
jgi:hypothetical protein